MQVITPSTTVLSEIDGKKILANIERYGRVCYKSEDKITEDSSGRFVKSIISRGHESVLEHEKITVRFICDRGVSHELVRHRPASFSQESTRYVNYNSSDIKFIKPLFFDVDTVEYNIWSDACRLAELSYKTLINNKVTPQEARTVLPNSLKTEVIITANLREWRHILKLRTSKYAHPQMREVCIPLLEKFKQLIPVVFEDIE